MPVKRERIDLRASRWGKAACHAGWLLCIAVGVTNGAADAADEADAAPASSNAVHAASASSNAGAASSSKSDSVAELLARANGSCRTPEGRVLAVGRDRAYAVPSAAAAAAQPGDTVLIEAGDYRGDAATWRVSGLTICGVGGRARLFADGHHAQGKALWVISGANAVVESIEFWDVHAPDRNGAGIRAEGENLTIRDCGFYDSDEGILGGRGVVTIDRSEFARNGFGDGQSHNVYIGNAERLVVTASYFHEAKIGHQLKSRAKETRVENSYFVDGPQGQSSYLIDTPDGGAVFLRGNLFHKGPRADNPSAIAFGREGLKWSTNTLEMVHNTIVMTYRGGTFIVASNGTQSVKLTANLFASSDAAQLIGGSAAAGIAQLNDNRIVDAAAFTGADDLGSPNFWPAASLRRQLKLSRVLDTGYTHEAPQPLSLRSLRAPPRLVGALQSER